MPVCTCGALARALPSRSMASGFLAACLGPVATGPFDVVKTRLMAQTKSGGLKYKVRGWVGKRGLRQRRPRSQAGSERRTWGSGTARPHQRRALAPRPAALMQGFFDALVKIPAEEGLLSMWKGLLPRLLRIPPGQAIVWAVSDQITGHFEKAALRERGDEAAPAPAAAPATVA